jgi:hypothetical protein
VPEVPEVVSRPVMAPAPVLEDEESQAPLAELLMLPPPLAGEELELLPLRLPLLVELPQLVELPLPLSRLLEPEL